jgi:hypothetical protein
MRNSKKNKKRIGDGFCIKNPPEIDLHPSSSNVFKKDYSFYIKFNEEYLILLK